MRALRAVWPLWTAFCIGWLAYLIRNGHTATAIGAGFVVAIALYGTAVAYNFRGWWR